MFCKYASQSDQKLAQVYVKTEKKVQKEKKNFNVKQAKTFKTILIIIDLM